MSERICVVCECGNRNTPKTTFSCRYKIHEKNYELFNTFFSKELEYGELCDSYRLWYKHKRGEGPKPIAKPTAMTAKSESDFMSKLKNYVKENEQRKSKRKINPIRSAFNNL
eukprot:gene1957-1465_t